MRRTIPALVALALLLLPALAQAAPTTPLGHTGRWITDAKGRTVIMHGVNMVFKRPPYYPAATGFGADDAAFGGDEDFEHRELLAGQRDIAAVAVDLSAEGIHPQTGDHSHRWPAVRAPAIERSEPEHELSELERLREVVVGAEPESGGLVVEAVGGGPGERDGRRSPR